MSDASHAVQANALIQNAKEKIGEIQTSISSVTNELETQIAQVATFQERGYEVAASIQAAAEGSQQYNYRIDEATQTVLYATNEMSASAIAHLQETAGIINEMYGMLSRAIEQLDSVVF